MNVFFDGVEALRARYAYLSGGGCTAICGGRRGAFRDGRGDELVNSAQVVSFPLGGERALENGGEW